MHAGAHSRPRQAAVSPPPPSPSLPEDAEGGLAPRDGAAAEAAPRDGAAAEEALAPMGAAADVAGEVDYGQQPGETIMGLEELGVSREFITTPLVADTLFLGRVVRSSSFGLLGSKIGVQLYAENGSTPLLSATREKSGSNKLEWRYVVRAADGSGPSAAARIPCAALTPTNRLCAPAPFVRRAARHDPPPRPADDRQAQGADGQHSLRPVCGRAGARQGAEATVVSKKGLARRWRSSARPHDRVLEAQAVSQAATGDGGIHGRGR